MMRDEVTVQDAIVAVAVMECSMQVSEVCPHGCGSYPDGVAYPQGAALLGSVDALHSSFPTNADEEYAIQGSATSGRGWSCVIHLAECQCDCSIRVV